MAIESAADRAVFVADFGEAVSWTVGATAHAMTAIFHNGTAMSDGFEGPPVLNRRATLSMAAASVPVGGGEGDAVSVGGVGYLVKSVEPDGTGWCLVRLEEDI